jgi:hypothetical protein
MTKEMSLYGEATSVSVACIWNALCFGSRTLQYAVLCGLLEGVLEGVLCGSMIDSSIVFCINGLGAVPTPRNTAPFQSQRRCAPAFTGISFQEPLDRFPHQLAS